MLLIFLVISSDSVPASTFPPHVIVSGLSVLYLNVTHGTSSVIASSCTPPESVSARVACDINYRKSRYPNGFII